MSLSRWRRPTSMSRRSASAARGQVGGNPAADRGCARARQGRRRQPAAQGLARDWRRSGAGTGGGASDKAKDETAARATLKKLRGMTHELHSAVALAVDGRVLWTHTGTARLKMRDFSDAFLEDISSAPAIASVSRSAPTSSRASAYSSSIISRATTSRYSACRSWRCWRNCVRRDDRDMKRACVIGWPIAHSRSPLIHGYWLRTLRHRWRLYEGGVPPEAVDAIPALPARTGSSAATSPCRTRRRPLRPPM